VSHKVEVDAFIEKTRQFVAAEKKMFFAALDNVPGIKLFPSTTSFFLGRLQDPMTAADVCARLARERILLRNCANFRGLSNRFIRISLKSAQANRMLVDKLFSWLHGPAARRQDSAKMQRVQG
ncbi:MAG: hypothetical protein JSW39_00115, partial [Desulfobacterales bacterium]